MATNLPLDPLVLILDGVSATTNPSVLAAVANDTFGSRKILLEREHRTVRETLADLAFFSAGTVVSGPHTLEAVSTPEINLDAKVLEDLSQRSPSIIFDGLLNDAYPVNHPRT